MFEIIDQKGAKAKPALAAAFAALAKDRGAQHMIVRLTPDGDTKPGWDWLANTQHDIAGALRSFRYLADKAKDAYAGDPKGEKVLASVARHLATIEALKVDLLDKVFPPDLAERAFDRE